MTDSNLPYVSELKDNFLRYVAVSSEATPRLGASRARKASANSPNFLPRNSRRSGSSRSN